MSPEKQRIALAKAHGWTNIKIIPLPAPNKKHSGEAGVIVSGARHPSWGFGSCSVSDYLNDKNAMHEAKKVLWDKGLMLEFVNQLIGIVCAAKGFRWDKVTADDHLILIANATAEQEAEAFLRTLGLWEEEQ